MISEKSTPTPSHLGALGAQKGEQARVARAQVEDATSVAGHMLEQDALSLRAARVGIRPPQIAVDVLVAKIGAPVREAAMSSFPGGGLQGSIHRGEPVPARTRGLSVMQHKVIPDLWFVTEAEQAAGFYISVFDNSRIVSVTHYTEAGPRAAGMVMTVEFELDGQPFVAINGGPQFTFSEAVSFQITCETQDEIDFYWERLSEGGRRDHAAG